MTLTEQAASDAQAVENAQAALNAATAQATVSASALLTVQPHLSLLAEIEEEATKLEGEAGVAIASVVARFRALLNV